MLIYNNKKFSIFFGDTQTSPFTIEKFKQFKDEQKDLLEKDILKTSLKVQNFYNFKQLVFLKQTHGTDSLVIKADNSENNKLDAINKNGDLLITNIPNLAIGVLTADCLPIIFYDTFNNVTAIAHAGWKGTTNNIALETVKQMSQSFGTKIENLKVFFGPSAKSCCYEVGPDFEKNIKNPKLKDICLIKKDNTIFFDLPLYNQTILEDINIKNIDLKYNLCTICNINFCSYRRDKEKSGLQMTIITLK